MQNRPATARETRYFTRPSTSVPQPGFNDSCRLQLSKGVQWVTWERTELRAAVTHQATLNLDLTPRCRCSDSPYAA